MEVFGNMIKHKCEHLIQLLKQICTSGENKGESLPKVLDHISKRAVMLVIFLCELLMSLRREICDDIGK